jgi:neurotransmitter:Na+ symporter, NSS family
MSVESEVTKNSWSSRTAFLLAAVGSSVGLGNFWRFPYEAGENGGGAFVIVYLACVLFVAMPLVVCELLIGRRGGLSAIGSTRKVAKAEGRSGIWSIIGWVGMLASFVLLSFYSVIAGWFIVYLPKLAFLSVETIEVGTETIVTAGQGALDRTARTGAMFNALMLDWKSQLLGHTIFMTLTVGIVYRGLHRGIEAAIKILMPIFFIMLFLLAIYALIVGDAMAGIRFLFTPDFSKITPDVMINALGHSFFSIGVGGAIMITYGAYLKKDVKIGQSAVIISLADTVIAMTAGLLIFPLVFKFHLEPSAGPGLLFVTMPVAFAEMEFGAIIGPVFFLLALVAALTSAISMLEIFVAWAEEKGLQRHVAALTGGISVWVLGLATVFSSTYLKDVKVLDKNPFDFFDFLTGSVMLPVGGLLVAIFVGWFVSRDTLRDELAMTSGQFSLWRFVTRFIAPVAVAGILLLKLGIVG